MPQNNSSLDVASNERYIALDGLRGFAALMVVFTHLLTLTEGFLPKSVSNLLYRTPLVLFVAGSEAVAIFFVLSGFVLTLPVLRKGARFRWGNYYVTRFLRLYLPTTASVIFAAGLVLFLYFPEQLKPLWIWTTFHNIDLPIFLRQLFFFIPQDFNINGVLWSLKWEMYFSLLLPVFVGAFWLLRKYWYLIAILCVVMVWYGVIQEANESAYQYFATFGFGVLIAVKRHQLLSFFRKIMANKGGKIAISILLPAISIFLLIFSRLVQSGVNVNHGTPTFLLIKSLYPLGAAGIVLSVLCVPAVRKFLSTRVLQFLGKISFSLYLVHLPVMLIVAHSLGSSNIILITVLAPIMALMVAVGFYKFIEAPSHRFSKWTGLMIFQKTDNIYPAKTAKLE